MTQPLPTITVPGADDALVTLTAAHYTTRLPKDHPSGKSHFITPRFVTLSARADGGTATDGADVPEDFDPFADDTDDRVAVVRSRMSRTVDAPETYRGKPGTARTAAAARSRLPGTLTLTIGGTTATLDVAPFVDRRTAESGTVRYVAVGRASAVVGVGASTWSVHVSVRPSADGRTWRVAAVAQRDA